MGKRPNIPATDIFIMYEPKLDCLGCYGEQASELTLSYNKD